MTYNWSVSDSRQYSDHTLWAFSITLEKVQMERHDFAWDCIAPQITGIAWLSQDLPPLSWMSRNSKNMIQECMDSNRWKKIMWPIFFLITNAICCKPDTSYNPPRPTAFILSKNKGKTEEQARYEKILKLRIIDMRSWHAQMQKEGEREESFIRHGEKRGSNKKRSCFWEIVIYWHFSK